MAKAAPRLDRATAKRLEDCPVLEGRALAEFKASVRAGSDFSLAVLKFLEGRTAEEQAAWLATSVQAGRTLLQPWSMELVFVLAVLGRARFNQLHDLLGMSTRTLSDKLQQLREAGFVEREVFDEQPVRIEYVLTRPGRAAAALASPLFAHLNLEALRRAGRLPARGA